MASPDTHRSQAKSLFKRGLITQKQHDRMLSKLNDIAAAAAPAANGGAAPDPAMSNAVAPAQAAALPVTVSVPGGKSAGDGVAMSGQ